MSERAGRQSPDPETQHPKQGSRPQAENPNQQGAAPDQEHAKQESEKQKHDPAGGLTSNPKGPLEEEAKEKVKKV